MHFQKPHLLALDGELPSALLIQDLRADASLLVAADGAALTLRALGIAPDAIIGDLDSIGEHRREFEEAGARVVHEPSQEGNDFEKALQWIVDNGGSGATVIGIAGGMTDHALNNFSVLARFARRLRLALRDDRSVAYVVHDRLSIAVDAGDRISLIPLPRALLTTSGLAWELAGEELALGVREGASNRAIGGGVEVVVSDGLLLLFHYPRRPDV